MQNEPEETRSDESQSIRDFELAKSKVPDMSFSWFEVIGYVVIFMSLVTGLITGLFWVVFHGMLYGILLNGVGQIILKLNELLKNK